MNKGKWVGGGGVNTNPSKGEPLNCVVSNENFVEHVGVVASNFITAQVTSAITQFDATL